MKLSEDQNLERVLQSAVVLSWTDLVRGAKSPLIHLEYAFAGDGTVDSIQIWSSMTRGYWLLACSYWMSASKSHECGVHFDNGYQSSSLAQILEVVMQNQKAFGSPPNFGRLGLLQITTPTQEGFTAAAASINNAFRSRQFSLTEILLAAC